MTYDVVALVEQAPDLRSLVKGMAEAGRELKVKGAGGGAVIQLCDDRGRPLVGVEAAQRVDVPDEVERLLGAETARRTPDPCWWVEARAVDADERSVAIAHRFADEMTRRLGGTAWSSPPRLRDRPGQDAERHPAVAAETEKTWVIVQDRPVVPMSSWVVDALAQCGRTGRGLQVVTPADARITFPLRLLLNSPKARWVVEHPSGGHYDGFSGIPLVWNDAAGFVPAPMKGAAAGPVTGFAGDGGGSGCQLLVDLKVRHTASDHLRLGGAAETLARTLGGAEPVAWGFAEPALSSWNRSALTEECRRRSPQPTWLVFAGPGGGERRFVGTQRVTRVMEGVKESVSFAVGYAEDEEPALDQLAELAGRFADQRILQTMTVHRCAGRDDVTYAPRWSGVPVPVGMAVGAEGVAQIGRERALAAPVPGKVLGPVNSPAVWYRFGDGTDTESWRDLDRLLKYLRPQGLARE